MLPIKKTRNGACKRALLFLKGSKSQERIWDRRLLVRRDRSKFQSKVHYGSLFAYESVEQPELSEQVSLVGSPMKVIDRSQAPVATTTKK